MITLELRQDLIQKVRNALEVGAEFDEADPPVDVTAVEQARAAITSAEALHASGTDIQITMEQPAFEAFKACVEVGGEGSDDITDDEWAEIQRAVAVNDGPSLAG